MAGGLQHYRGVNETISSLLLVYIALAILNHPASGFAIADEVAIDQDSARLHPFQMIEAADKGRLSGARSADDDDHLPAPDRQRNPFQDFDLSEGLVNVGRLDHGFRHL